MTSTPFDEPLKAIVDLGPVALAKFLNVAGWEKVRETSGVLSVWAQRESGASLMLPLDVEFKDYNRRLYDALEVISNVHHVRGEALALEIASASSDILLLRADQDSIDGTIPLREAEALLLGARKMLTAAALSAVSRKANFGPARPPAVKEFINDDVRMGHTMHGSFIITILARLDDEEVAAETPAEEASDKGPAERDAAPPVEAPIEMSFNRRVMTTLATGLSAASELLDTKQALDLDAAVERGVSSQLLDSIADISGFEGVRSIDTTFRWSPSHTSPGPDVPARVQLPQRSREQVLVVRDRLRRRPSISTDQVIGQVVRLERAKDDAEGIAVVDGVVGKERKRVRVRLAPSAYAQATSAHEQREPVLVEGDITFERGSYRIQSPRAFEELRNRTGSA